MVDCDARSDATRSLRLCSDISQLAQPVTPTPPATSRSPERRHRIATKSQVAHIGPQRASRRASLSPPLTALRSLKHESQPRQASLKLPLAPALQRCRSLGCNVRLTILCTSITARCSVCSVCHIGPLPPLLSRAPISRRNLTTPIGTALPAVTRLTTDRPH